MAESQALIRLRLLGAQAFSSDARRAKHGLDGLSTSASRSAREMGTVSRRSRQMEGAIASAGRAGHTAGRGISTLGYAAGAAAVTGIYALSRGLGVAAREYQESAKVGAQTAAVIKSTGGAANVTAKQVGDLAGAISAKTAIDDEQIQSGANMLLTFTNLRNEAGRGNKVFDQATSVLTDMSVALGNDPKRAAIQLGKALNDPVKGITALTRVGVTFTKGQQNTIKSLVASGDRLKAQKLILRELGKEFGGSAAAAATPVDHLKTDFNNLAESVGGLGAPLVNKGVVVLDKLVRGLQTGKGAGGVIARTVKAVASTVGGVATGIIGRKPADTGAVGERAMGNAARRVKPSSAQAFGAVLRRDGQAVLKFLQGKVIPGVTKVAKQLLDAFAPARPFFENVLLPLLKGIGEGVLISVVGAFKVLVPIIKIVATGFGAVGKVAKPLKPVFEGIGLAIGFLASGPILKGVAGIGRLGAGMGKLGFVFRIAGGAVRLMLLPLRMMIAVTSRAISIVGRFGRVFSLAPRLALRSARLLIRAWTFVPRMLLRIGSNASNSVIRGLSSMVRMASSIGRRAVSGLVRTVRGGIGRMRSAGGAIWRALVGGLKTAISGGAGFAADIGKGVANAVIGLLNSAIPNKLAIPGAPDINLPDNPIPRFAHGGVTRGGWGIFGENGPELGKPPAGTRIYNARDSRRMMRRAEAMPARPILIQFEPHLDGRVLHSSVHRVERQLVEGA